MSLGRGSVVGNDPLGHPVHRGYALPVSSSASDGLHRIRVTGPHSDPRSIGVAER